MVCWECLSWLFCHLNTTRVIPFPSFWSANLWGIPGTNSYHCELHHTLTVMMGYPRVYIVYCSVSEPLNVSILPIFVICINLNAYGYNNSYCPASFFFECLILLTINHCEFWKLRPGTVAVYLLAHLLRGLAAVVFVTEMTAVLALLCLSISPSLHLVFS